MADEFIGNYPAMSTLQGDEKLLGVQDGSTSLATPADLLAYALANGAGGGGGGGGDAPITTTVAAFQASTWDASVKAVYIQGYSTVGVGGFWVRRVNAQPTHPWWFRSVDRWTMTGGTDPTNGGYWEGYTLDGRITIESFGGKGDNSTDNLSAFNNFHSYVDVTTLAGAAAGTIYTQSNDASTGYTLVFGPGIYKFSDTIVIKRAMKLQGLSNGQEGSGHPTSLVFPENIGGIIVCYYMTPNGKGSTDNTTPTAIPPNCEGASGTIISGLALHGGGTRGVFTTPGAWYANGIWLRTRALVENCYVHNFAGHGYKVNGNVWGEGGRGDTIGNVNGFVIRDCTASYCGYHGFYTNGTDANAGYTLGVSVDYCSGAGIYDATFLGAAHVAPQIMECGFRTEYSSELVNRAFVPMVRYNGNYFYCAYKSADGTDAASQTTPPPLTATSNTYWVYVSTEQLTYELFPSNWLSPVNYVPVWGQVQDDDGKVYTVVPGQESLMWVRQPKLYPGVWGTGVTAVNPPYYLPWAKAAKMAAGTGDTTNAYKARLSANSDALTHMVVGPYSEGGTIVNHQGNGFSVFIQPYKEDGQFPIAMLSAKTLVIGGNLKISNRLYSDAGISDSLALRVVPSQATVAQRFDAKGTTPPYTIVVVQGAPDNLVPGAIMNRTDSGSRKWPIMFDGTDWRYL